jgi:hypothetical protein
VVLHATNSIRFLIMAYGSFWNPHNEPLLNRLLFPFPAPGPHGNILTPADPWSLLYVIEF